LDLLIAATAGPPGCRANTGNPDDFRDLDDLMEVVAV
jgi:hypothetical protein